MNAVAGRLHNGTASALVALIVQLSAVAVAAAQVVGAILTGTVTDSSGAAMVNALVTIRNVDTGIVTVAHTNHAGHYSAPNLLPGDYAISAEAPGWIPAELPRLTLSVGERQIVNIQMRMAAIAAEVEVTAGAMPGIGSAAVSDVVDGRAARDLPLNGRDWTQLALLEPAISPIRTQPSGSGVNNRGNRGFGSQLTIAGARPQQNSYRLDGISVDDYAQSSPGTTDGITLGAEAIAQFLVISSNHSASYGLASGGIISAVTRAGTNRHRGSAYAFLRDDSLEARGYFDDTKLPFHRHQLGLALGGPIVRNRAFFFANYECRRESLTTTGIATVPSAAARAGRLAGGDIAVDPAVRPYLELFALPNGAIAGDTGLYEFPRKAVVPEHFVSGRVDHAVSARDHLHGTYMFDRGSTTQPDALNVLLTFNETTRQVAAFEETHVFGPQLVNTARVGVNRVRAAVLQTAPGANPLGADPSLGIAPGLYAPVIQVGGLTNFGGGLNGTSFGDYWYTTWQMYDDIVWNAGRHSLKAGFAFERIHSNFLLAANPNGVYRFDTLADFLGNRPTSLQLQSGGLTPRALRQNVFGVYVEDDYRPAANLTLNFGLRYEPASVPTEVDGKLANLRTLGSAEIHTGDPLFRNPTLMNLAPRVGVAWDPFRTGRTTIRAGFGMFDVLPLTYQFNLMQVAAAPFQTTSSSSDLPPGSFPSGAVSLVQLGPSQRTSFIEFEPKRNYVMQWNATVERDVRGVTVMAGYVGSRGVHNAMRTTDANGVIPSTTPDGLVWPCAGTIADGVCSRPGGGARFNPFYGQIDGQVWNGSSRYNALLLTARRRVANGFAAQLSFTWSRSEDTGSSVGSGGPFLNSVSGQFLFAPQRALSDFHVGRTLVGSGTWQIPFGRSTGWGGWQISGIVHISDGQPFTPLIAGDALGQANQSLFDVPDRIDRPGCERAIIPGNPSQYIKLDCFAFPMPGTRFGNAGRNSLIGPGFATIDLSLVKNTPLGGASGRTQLQIRAEVFNLTNRANFAAPLANDRLFDATGAPVSFAGQITTLAGSPRQVQIGVKILW